MWMIDGSQDQQFCDDIGQAVKRLFDRMMAKPNAKAFHTEADAEGRLELTAASGLIQVHATGPAGNLLLYGTAQFVYPWPWSIQNE
jgi:hypothetical protein